jgi:uncharacterized phiE125 gp8 family phage protein
MFNTYNYNANLVRQWPHYDPQYNLTVVTPPSTEPVSFDELADQLRLDQTDDQAYVQALGQAGRQYVETSTKLTLMQTTYTASYDTFNDCGIKLPRRPVTSVTSVQYYDQNGTLRTLSTDQYWVDTKSIWTRIRPVVGTVFPITQIGRPNTVTVTFVAGTATDAANVSELAKLAITSWVAFMYENREAAASEKKPQELPYAFEAILWMLGAPEAG